MKADLYIGILLCALADTAVWKKKALTAAALAAADVMLMGICILATWREAAFLFGMYITVFLVDLILKEKIRASVQGTQGKGGPRGLRQILANGSMACAMIVLFFFTGRRGFLLGYYASIFEVLADSLASDVGVTSKAAPRDICTGRRTASGMSGGVTLLGSGISGIACICAGVLVYFCVGLSVPELLAVAILPYGGMILDSVLGSLVQVKYQCVECGQYTERRIHCGKKTVHARGITWMSNSLVNFLCTCAAGICMAVLF